MCLTPEQAEGIRLHDIERTRLVNLVKAKHEAKRQAEKDFWNQKEGKANQAKKQTR